MNALREVDLGLLLLALSFGIWACERDSEEPPLSSVQQEEISRLEAIGYLAEGGSAPRESGVTIHDSAHAYDGLNFAVSANGPEATLLDMQGRVLHQWSKRFDEIWPGRQAPASDADSDVHYWRRAYPLEDGDLLILFEGGGIARLDRDSNVVWRNPIAAHHDLHVSPHGEIAVLTRAARLIPRLDPKRPVLEDFVSILDSQGRLLRQISVIEAFEASKFAGMLERRSQRAGDILHTNAIEILEGRAVHRHPAFAAGRALVSIRYLDALAVLDLERAQVVWAYQGSFARQHDPQVLADGTLLLFDNAGLGERSRVLQLDPATGKTIWEYRGTEDGGFRSGCCGTSYRLPNGNTLINETDAGRSFEVTPDGSVVWEFINPHRLGESDAKIARLFDLVRLEKSYGASWLPVETGCVEGCGVRFSRSRS